MPIKIAILQVLAAEAAEIGMERRKIACNSRPIAGLLYYLKLTVPMFSGSAVGKDALECGLAEKYPEIWAEVEKLVPDFGRVSFVWDWRAPKVKKGILEKVRGYLEEPRSRSVISIYTPRGTVLIEYLRRTEPDTSMSRICVEILEEEFRERLPDLWKEMESL